MKAKEMFEKLGYKQDIYNNSAYQVIKYYNDKHTSILFCIDNKNFTNKSIEKEGNEPLITLEELQAINKQVEELGWNE